MKRWLTALVLVLTAAACSSPQDVQLRSTLTATQLRPFAQSGHRFVHGQAFLRTRGGNVKPCAGFDAVLLPDVPLVREALEVWRSGEMIDTATLPKPKSPQAVRWSTCDTEGRFIFDDLPPEDYWVMAKVTWVTPSKYSLDDSDVAGGWLVRKISLKYQSEPRVILTIGDTTYRDARPWEITPSLH